MLFLHQCCPTSFFSKKSRLICRVDISDLYILHTSYTAITGYRTEQMPVTRGDHSNFVRQYIIEEVILAEKEVNCNFLLHCHTKLTNRRVGSAVSNDENMDRKTMSIFKDIFLYQSPGGCNNCCTREKHMTSECRKGK